MADSLSGLRVLVLEDEMIIAFAIEDMLADFGCTVIGPAASVSEALTLVSSSEIDAALLDVNLGREKSYPLADRLSEIGVPFVFVTGYAEISPSYTGRPHLQKPFNTHDLRSVLENLPLERVGGAPR